MLSGFFVTKKGKNLLAKTHDGANIELTRAEIGSGDIPEGQLVTEVTSLYGKVKELPLGEVKVGSGKEVCIPVQLTNKGVLTSFLFKEIGVYAIDPDEGEILYLYGNTDVTGDVPDEVKSESESQVDYLFNLLLNIDNTTKVDVNVDNSLIYATLQNLSDMADTKVDKVAGKGLSTEDYTTAEKNKLAGIAAGANKYVHPSNHPMSMITGLGTAATKNTGTTAGNIPLIGSDGLLPTSVLPPPLIVENVLTSTSTVNALSAAQGKVLNDAKVDKVSGKGLSTNDYTTAEKNKLAGIAAGANNYVHPPTHPVGMITGLGTAATKDVGTAEGNVVGVNSDGEIDSTLIGSLDHVGTDGYIVYPSGGQINSSLTNTIGMLKITLPVSWSLTMLKFKVSIFNLKEGTSVDYILAGYNFNISSGWTNTTAYCVSPWGKALSNLPVTFGHDGTKSAITIGAPTTTWNYPRIAINNIKLAAQNFNYDTWKSGWNISFVTEALPTVSKTITNTNISYNVNHASSATDADKVGHKLTIGSKTYDGSAAMTITSDDVPGLGTAATKNTGTAAGNVPILGSDGKLPEAILPESLSGGATGQTWHAKDILGSGTTSTADATAESGYSVTIDTTAKNLNGSAKKYKAPFGTYVAIFRVQASTISSSADKVKLEIWGTSAAIASRTLKLSDFSAASKWEYFKIPFETDSTSGRDIYPKATCLNATGNVKVDNIVVVPNAFALM